ncbi:hypothetical protein ABNF97_06455 [Plantactinospora sp. B6F1]|uniref:golvesin C-terminal-like domain-containing protein n=1 Tax=Plantactinospora sp. B6F1 TaxID=3158971 RepID=UPI0032D9A097
MKRRALMALVAGLVTAGGAVASPTGDAVAHPAGDGATAGTAVNASGVNDPVADPGPLSRWIGVGPAGRTTAAPAAVAPAAVVCDGDGTSGKRVRILYVRETSQTDRLAQFQSTFQQWAAQIDEAFFVDAQATGGYRRVRWVHDASCVPTVTRVVVPNGTLGDFGDTFDALKSAGYNSTSRKYLAYAETTSWCGLGGGGPGANDSRPGAENRYNSGPELATMGTGCWGWAPSAHELLHTLGAVLPGAPNATAHGHCWDDEDIMCYDDGGIPNPPGQLVKVCPGAPENQLDCNHDDYYNVRPAAGTWLASHWNVANSQYLISTPPAWSVIVDNTSTSFRASANWQISSYSTQRYGADYGFANPEPISDPAWYSADLPGNGTYKVEVWYPATSGYNDRTPYVVVTSSGNQTVHVNQRTNGGKWVTLGTYPMSAGAHDVVGVSRWTAGTGYVIADAIRLTRVS